MDYVRNICDRVLDNNHEEWADPKAMPALVMTGEQLGQFKDEEWQVALKHQEIGKSQMTGMRYSFFDF